MIDHSFFDPIYERKNTGAVKYAGITGDIIPMWIADMDFMSPPTVREAVVKTARHGIYGYGYTDDEYYSAVAEWYGRRFGRRIAPEQIIKVPGVMFGAAAAIRSLTEPGDGVMICQPVYYPFANIISANCRRGVISELILNQGRYEMDFEDIEERIRREKVRAFLLCSPHNPVGRVWTREELLQLAEICLRNGVYIISDEIHSDFVYPGHKHSSIADVSREAADITVTCVSPTKTFNIAGLQAANILVSNRQLRRRIREECAATGCSELNIMAIAAAKAAYSGGEEWLEALLRYLQRNIALLNSVFPGNYPVHAMNMEGTYLAWLDCRRLGLPPDELDELFLKRAGVRLHNGKTFGAGGAGFMRMNIACPFSVLEEAAERIKKAVGVIGYEK